MCGNGCVFRDEDTIIHCYRRIQIASVLTDRFFCWTWEAPRKQKLYFHSKLQTQTTALVQYMNTLFKKQIKCHSCEGTCCLRSLGTVHSEALVSKIDLPSIKERYKSPHNGPSTSGHLLTLSIFQFFKTLKSFQSLSPSSLHLWLASSYIPVWMVQVGPPACSQADCWLIQAENRGLGEGQEMEGELSLLSYTLALESCTLGAVSSDLWHFIPSVQTKSLSEKLAKNSELQLLEKKFCLQRVLSAS